MKWWNVVFWSRLRLDGLRLSSKVNLRTLKKKKSLIHLKFNNLNKSILFKMSLVPYFNSSDESEDDEKPVKKPKETVKITIPSLKEVWKRLLYQYNISIISMSLSEILLITLYTINILFVYVHTKFWINRKCWPKKMVFYCDIFFLQPVE